MIILLYIGILLMCYGIYHILCYLSMLPTAGMGRGIPRTGKSGCVHRNPFIIGMAEQLVNKWELEMKSSDQLQKILLFNKIYYSETVYCVSLILTALGGLFLCLPILFIDMRWFCELLIGVAIYVFYDFGTLLFRYQKMQPKTDVRKKIQKKWQKKCIRLLPWAFFICQIILFISLLT